MNESTWLRSDDPQELVSFLEGKVSDRKLRLFACACCRRYGMILSEDVSRQAIETAERFADGQATVEELTRARERIGLMFQEGILFDTARGCLTALMSTDSSAINAARATLHATGDMFLQNVSYGNVPGFDERGAVTLAVRTELWEKSELLRHIVGNPFRPVAVDPAWLRWNDGTIVKMAQAIYDENRFDDLAFLADALQDAGCDNEEILSHCRASMEHPRGCWVVDALLRKV